MNVGLVVIVIAFIEIGRIGGSDLGAILGMIAGLASCFVLYTVGWMFQRGEPANPATHPEHWSVP